MDLNAILARLTEDGSLTAIAESARIQFGTPTRPRLAATIFPELPVVENAFRERQIKFSSLHAAFDAERYSSVKLGDRDKSVGSYLVELGNQSIADFFDAAEADAVRAALKSDANLPGLAEAVKFYVSIVESLADKSEAQRWSLIEDAQVVRLDESLQDYPDPADHRVAADGSWANDANDPMDDIFKQADLLRDKGHPVVRIIMSSKLLRVMAANANIVTAVQGTESGRNRVSVDDVQALLQAEGLPEIETFDGKFLTEDDEWIRFLTEDTVVYVGATEKDQEIDVGEDAPIMLPNVSGYTAIGKVAGEAMPGRVINTEVSTRAPKGLYAECLQTSLPVLQFAESIATTHSALG